MADIKSLTDVILAQDRGEDVRDAIVAAFRYMLTYGVDKTGKWNGHPASDFLTVEEMHDLLYNNSRTINGTTYTPFDEMPTANSKRAVTSAGIYTVIHAIEQLLDEINGEVIES